MEARSEGRARVPPDGEPLLDEDAAARTGLRGERRWHGYGSLPSVCCFESEDSAELPPAGIADALGEGVVPHQVGHLQVFVIDRVVLPDQRKRLLMMEVLPYPADRLMGLRQELDRLAPAMAALLAPRHAALGSPQVQFGDAEDARV